MFYQVICVQSYGINSRPMNILTFFFPCGKIFWGEGGSFPRLCQKGETAVERTWEVRREHVPFNEFHQS